MTILKSILVFILTLESKLILGKYKPFIIAVTGSVGKTSTKDAIYCLLKDQRKFVRKSEKSQNSEIGLPLTVIGAPNAWKSLSGWLGNIGRGLGLILKKQDYPDCLIVEVGADHPGDIKTLTKWLKPDIAVITRVSRTPVHVEFFKDAQAVFEEKAYLAKAVKEGGSLVLFADDEKVSSLGYEAKERGLKVLDFGQSAGSEVSCTFRSINYENSPIKAGGLTDEHITPPESQASLGRPIGFSFALKINGQEGLVNLKDVIGEVNMYPVTAAAAVAHLFGLSNDRIFDLANQYEAPHGRLNLVAGINGSTIIDDTYNSSPDATEAALEALSQIRTSGKKVAILGDMMELGKHAVEAHRKIGLKAAKLVHLLVTVGSRSRLTGEEARLSGLASEKIKSFATANEASQNIASEIGQGDIVLVKGSQSMRMERITKVLMAHPERANELLVRQEKDWLEKDL